MEEADRLTRLRLSATTVTGQPLGECVEVADTAPGGRAVRDSKQYDGPLLTVSRDSWQAFIRQFA
ncbi:DUF397 domain-containing protein [Streptomyces eurythermus]|uniref:DUF397 domain-containing protein n=1 Tax=Streptomyces eurythermus TaxID=42237 RepID=UPI0036FD72CA